MAQSHESTTRKFKRLLTQLITKTKSDFENQIKKLQEEIDQLRQEKLERDLKESNEKYEVAEVATEYENRSEKFKSILTELITNSNRTNDDLTIRIQEQAQRHKQAIDQLRQDHESEIQKLRRENEELQQQIKKQQEKNERRRGTQDVKPAMQRFRLAAEQGDAEAQHNYDNGKGDEKQEHETKIQNNALLNSASSTFKKNKRNKRILPNIK